MSEFELFKKVIVGRFNNYAQVEMEKQQGKIIHPLAKHINTICNDKIKNLPKGFEDIFVIEESYYTDLKSNRTNILPHLFLFEKTPSGKVKLISYETPKYISKKDFTNDNVDLIMDYNDLEVSSKFTPFTYEYTEGTGFSGGSLSHFGPDTTLLLEETLREDTLEVNEVLKKGDKVLIGFESPIIYKRE